MPSGVDSSFARWKIVRSVPLAALVMYFRSKKRNLRIKDGRVGDSGAAPGGGEGAPEDSEEIVLPAGSGCSVMAI